MQSTWRGQFSLNFLSSVTTTKAQWTQIKFPLWFMISPQHVEELIRSRRLLWTIPTPRSLWQQTPEQMDGAADRLGAAHILKYTENHWQREWWSTWRGRETFCYATVNWLDKKNVSHLNVSHLRAGVNGTVARQVQRRKRKTDPLNTFPSLSELPRGRQLHFPF